MRREGGSGIADGERPGITRIRDRLKLGHKAEGGRMKDEFESLSLGALVYQAPPAP